MIPAIVRLTLRECLRRSFPYVLVIFVSLLALCSHLFQAFSFGAGDLEAANLAISAVFLAGLLHAAFLATATIRSDLERGTLGLMLSQPVAPAAYVVGRFLGLALSMALIATAVAGAMIGIFGLPFGRVELGGILSPLLEGSLRALPPLLILEAAALAASALLSRLMAPFALLAFFLAGTLAEGPILGVLLPDFSVFALEAGPGVSLVIAFGYALSHTAFYLGLAYLAVTWRAPLRSQT